MTKTLSVLSVAVLTVALGAGVAWAERAKKGEGAKKPAKPKAPLSVEEMFALVDANKDKSVELSEVVALKQLKGDEAQAKKLLAAWDGDGDGKATLEEFKKFVEAIQKARAEQAAKLDANGDKVLSLDEVKGLKQVGGDEAKAKALLERLDDNGDGKVSIEEFARFRNLTQLPPPSKGARKAK